MAHISETELTERLKKAAIQVGVGAFYTHYKNPDQHYKVLSIVISEANDEPCVIYEAQYGDHIAFVRPVASWLEEIEWNNKSVKRFTKVG